MDLAKVPNDKKLNLCRWYFRVGCALLPFVWTINAIWFYNEAFRKPEYEEQKQIRKYVIFSAIGSAIWFMLLVTWVTIFQLNRASWGAFADHISFIIPVGTP
ncbi:gamma-secretase subunit pen-2 [Anoplophora glabripennis]|uniref:gamma-secretase subunit pen-2 n=1 Tax=Anoplophora glabripennis TaxID=217634 RepID=UPI00087361C4|nr:gamma-secretase subunit pen-2 [Anoplophora glabripennis]